MRLLLLLLVLSLPVWLSAGDPATADEAEALVAQGKTAMRESDHDHRRVVDAAICFGQALTWYQAQNDLDKVCDLQADIFWCKKRMNLDDLGDYVAQKHQDASATAALATVERVAGRTVAANEAQAFLDRAQDFASKHPDDPMQISIRFFEVAERFQGTDISLTAQRLSLDAQQRASREQADAAARQRDTLFSKPAAAGAKAELPSADALKTAVATVKDLFKDDYAKTKPKARLALIAKLLDQAGQAGDEPALRCALASEARDLAIALKNPTRTLAAVELLAASFTGVDAVAAKKAALARIGGVPAVTAMIKLLDTPGDPEANTTAGRYFACEANDWTTALPLLAHGADRALAKPAEMELAGPATPAQQGELGDQWYELGKKAANPVKEALLGRALTWYEQAAPGIKGISHAVMLKRIDELHALLPRTAEPDWDHLTAAQWDKLKGPVYEVQANRARNDTGIRLADGQLYRVVPHPSDTWHVTGAGRRADFTTTYKGDEANRHWGSLLCYVGAGRGQAPGVLSGVGELWLAGDIPRGRMFTASGQIRVKIIPVEDD
jgi:hypothetical protein